MSKVITDITMSLAGYVTGRAPPSVPGASESRSLTHGGSPTPSCVRLGLGRGGAPALGS